LSLKKTRLIDPVQLAAKLVRCPSVTPIDAGALDILQQALEGLGFRCTRLAFSSEKGGRVENLYARWGTGVPNFCFAGHSDVVPIGLMEDWSFPPFSGEVKRGFLYGRGASDMKGAIAAFVAAAERFLIKNGKHLEGSVSFLITGDEEGPAKNGTIRVLEWLEEKGEKIDFCLVGEPTNPKTLGEMIKNGRRGSLNITITVQGRQAHVAYPERGENPVPGLTRILNVLENYIWDQGTECFPPSNLEVTNLDAGTGAFNVIPAKAAAKFNIRFNNLHTSQSLIGKVEQLCVGTGIPHVLDFQIIGEAFLTEAPVLIKAVSKAVEEVTGKAPELSTSGGSSDARFIKDMCPVIEFGLTGETIHAIDERVRIGDIENLSRVYEKVLTNIFAKAG
jgi:succinyl-diaminopimelate desuccinylase